MTWSLNDSEAAGNLVFDKDITAFCVRVDQVVLILNSWKLNEQSREICIKARLTPASLASISQGTKFTTVKRTLL